MPGDQTVAALAEIQEELLALAPGLLRCPPASLHVTVLPLIEIRRRCSADRHEIWRRHGARWVNEIRRSSCPEVLNGLTYRRLLATDSAVIALLEPAAELIAHRDALRRRLGLPERASAQRIPGLVHTTLFRYGSAVLPDETLAHALRRTTKIPLVNPLPLLCHDVVYPHLEFEVLARLDDAHVREPIKHPTG